MNHPEINVLVMLDIYFFSVADNFAQIAILRTKIAHFVKKIVCCQQHLHFRIIELSYFHATEACYFVEQTVTCAQPSLSSQPSYNGLNMLVSSACYCNLQDHTVFLNCYCRGDQSTLISYVVTIISLHLSRCCFKSIAYHHSNSTFKIILLHCSTTRTVTLIFGLDHFFSSHTRIEGLLETS